MNIALKFVLKEKNALIILSLTLNKLQCSNGKKVQTTGINCRLTGPKISMIVFVFGPWSK